MQKAPGATESRICQLALLLHFHGMPSRWAMGRSHLCFQTTIKTDQREMAVRLHGTQNSNAQHPKDQGPSRSLHHSRAKTCQSRARLSNLFGNRILNSQVKNRSLNDYIMNICNLFRLLFYLNR